MELRKGLHLFQWEDPGQNNCNTYLVLGEKKILIDPGHFALFGHVLSGLELMRLEPGQTDALIVTHFHPDHMEAVRRFKGLNTWFFMFGEEFLFLKEVYSAYMGADDLLIEPQVLLKEGELIVGDIELQIIHTPGHSPGHICIYWPLHKALFSGDLLFQNGIGRTDLPGGNPDTLRKSLKRIEGLDLELLLPGHGPPVIGKDRVERNFRLVKDIWQMYL